MYTVHTIQSPVLPGGIVISMPCIWEQIFLQNFRRDIVYKWNYCVCKPVVAIYEIIMLLQYHSCFLSVIMVVYRSLKIMECHSVVQRKVKFINVHLVVRVIIMVRVGRLTGAVLLPTGQATLCFTLCMDRWVSSGQVPNLLISSVLLQQIDQLQEWLCSLWLAI